MDRASSLTVVSWDASSFKRNSKWLPSHKGNYIYIYMFCKYQHPSDIRFISITTITTNKKKSKDGIHTRRIVSKTTATGVPWKVDFLWMRWSRWVINTSLDVCRANSSWNPCELLTSDLGKRRCCSTIDLYFISASLNANWTHWLGPNETQG